MSQVLSYGNRMSHGPCKIRSVPGWYPHTAPQPWHWRVRSQKLKIQFEIRVLGSRMKYQSLGKKMPLPRFDAFVSRFPPTHKGEICCSSLQGTPNVNSTPNLNNTANTINIQSKINTHKTFRTRLRIFYQRMIDHGSVRAFKHTTTTINKPPDPGEINDDIIFAHGRSCHHRFFQRVTQGRPLQWWHRKRARGRIRIKGD